METHMTKTVVATILLLGAGTMFAAAEERTVVEEHPGVVLPAPHDRSVTVEKSTERGGCESKTVHNEDVEGSKTVHKENCD
jgi:hypothetical protein